jgi:tRNA pseudouridine55 synthase
MQGLLLIDKPAGWTSFDVVNYVRRIVANKLEVKPKSIKVGHIGTLDPFATGLLVLLVGKSFTKLAPNYSKLDKSYEVVIELGQTSTTGDPEGAIKHVSDDRPTREQIKEALKPLTGEIMQRPPLFSAIKINGQRAYKLARAGSELKLDPRQVTVHELKLISYKYPNLEITTEVSSGTYIRSLVEDLGSNLTTGAYTTSLRRISISNFKIEDSVEVKNVTEDNISELLISNPNVVTS